MRVSDQQIIALTQFQLNADYEQLAQAQTVLATGRQINTPSDNPIGAAAALELQGTLAQTNQFSSTASDTLSWLQTTESSLGGVADMLTQARTLAVQAANGTLTPDERQAIASNLGQLLQQAVQNANGTYSGRYVLSGFKTNTAPFTLTPSGVQYNGDGGQMVREISAGQTMQINTPGNTPALGAAFNAMYQLQQDVQNNNGSAIGSTDLAAIDSANDQMLVAQANVGAGINRIQSDQNTLQTTQNSLTGQISTLVDANMAQAAVNFSTYQATYQAALSAASKIMQPTLLQFLQ